MNIEEYLENEKLKDEDLSFKELEQKIFKIGGQSKVNEFFNLANNCYEKNEIREFYNFLSEEHMSKIQRNLTVNQFVNSAEYINKKLFGSKIILDIGCNDGLKTIFYAINNPKSQIIGIDIAENPLNIAKEKSDRNKCKNVRFFKKNFLNKPIRHKFDIIILDHVLHELFDNYAGKLKSYLRPLMNDGGLMITSLTPSDMEYHKFEWNHQMPSEGLIQIEERIIPYFRFKEKKEAYVSILRKN